MKELKANVPFTEEQVTEFNNLILFSERVLEGQLSFGPDDMADLSEAVKVSKQVLRLARKYRLPEFNLNLDEVETLLWLYEKTAEWRGNLMPQDFPEFDGWLKGARELLLKLGVSFAPSSPNLETAQDKIIRELWAAHSVSQTITSPSGDPTGVMTAEAFDVAVRELIDRLPGLVFPAERPMFDGTRAEVAAIRAADGKADLTHGKPARAPRKPKSRGAARARRHPSSRQTRE